MSEKYFDNFEDTVGNEIDLSESMDKMMRFMPDEVIRANVDETKNTEIPSASLSKLMKSAKRKGNKRTWLTKSEIKNVSDMDDETFESYWKSRKSKYNKTRHFEFSENSNGEDIVCPGRRGMTRNETFTVDDMVNMISDEHISDEEIENTVFGSGDAWFTDKQNMELIKQSKNKK